MLDDFLVDISGVERWLRDLKTLPRIKRDGSVTKAPEPVSRKAKDHYKAVLHRLAECSVRWGTLGFPLEVQQKLMRHASITMTVHYGNSGMDESKRDANRQLVEYVTQTQNGSTRVI